MIQRFDFDTNIERRMPATGKVFYVNRMTSDYAVAHPFDVDAFIEEVFQKYERIVQEDAHARAAGWNKSREELRRQWTRTLSMGDRGDKSVCPWDAGNPQPALMDVWHAAGDFWRRGLRADDTLPAVIPPCRITRLEGGGWIALFPNELRLLEGSQDSHAVSQEKEDSPTLSEVPEPRQLDLFDTATQDDAARDKSKDLRDLTNITMMTPEPRVATQRPGRDARVAGRRPRKSSAADGACDCLYGVQAITVSSEQEDGSAFNRKVFAALATAVVFLVLVNYVGIFGIAAIGLLAGGVIK